MHLLTRAAVCLALLSCACTSDGGSGADPRPTSNRDLGAAVATAVDDQRTAAARDLAEVQSVVVVHDGTTVYEDYFGTTPETYQEIASVTKSFMSTLIGIAVDRGEISGVDATLGELLPDHRDVMTPAVAGTTLEQVLTMTGGFAGEFDDEDGEEWIGAADPLEVILTTPARPPGERFAYSNGGVHLLGAVLEQATGTTVLDYARRVLFDPLGIDTRPAAQPVAAPENLDEYAAADFAWPTDPTGLVVGSGALKLRPRDLAKLGQLYLDNGSWHGDQVVPRQWVADATTAQVDSAGLGLDTAYGYLWWVSEIGGDPAYVAYGYGGQAIRVIPDRDLVIVVSTAIPELDSEGAPYFAVLFLMDEVIAPLFE